MAKTITTRYPACCADCGADIPVGSTVRWFGRGRVSCCGKSSPTPTRPTAQSDWPTDSERKRSTRPSPRASASDFSWIDADGSPSPAELERERKRDDERQRDPLGAVGSTPDSETIQALEVALAEAQGLLEEARAENAKLRATLERVLRSPQA